MLDVFCLSMADRAQITSVEAIEAFRSALIIYLTKARPALEEMSNEVLRSKQWLQNDQRRLWEGEMKKRAKKLERAKAELFSVSMSKLQEVSSAQQMIVHRAKHACEEAEKKLALLKKWDHELDNRADPLVKQVDQFLSFVSTELPRAIASLTQMIRTLEAYADVGMGGASDAGAATKIEEQPAEGAAPDANKPEKSD
jgi:hypothetical protein